MDRQTPLKEESFFMKRFTTTGSSGRRRQKKVLLDTKLWINFKMDGGNNSDGLTGLGL